MPMARNPNRAGSNVATRTQSDISGSDYAERARRLIELTNDLKALGANHLLDIPRVVFIGNQSAGKSSVVEGVTGTKVPRDSGTCTRCPMECTMTKHAGAWQCTIKLRIEFENDGSERLNPNNILFAELNEPNDVELWLKRAQAAVLYPGDLDAVQVALFKTKSAEDIRTMQGTPGALLSFSFNTVEFYVRDPNGVDLSFVDLPGIIQHHSTDSSMVDLVKKLVKHAIKGLNTLIVLTIPMTDDVENQEAFVLAKEADPQGKRTIGVGTKPDMLQAGNTGLLSTWKEILLGNAHTLQHGYFCVKLPDDAIRAANHSRTELQRQELAFFTSTEPWRSFENRGRFGIKNFVKSTSRLLINLIETNLPLLKEEVDKLLAKDMAEYDQLPVVVDDEQPLHIILPRITAFCQAFNKTIHGDKNKDYTHKNRAVYRKFQSQVMATAPEFQTATRRPVQITNFYAQQIPDTSRSDLISVQDVRRAIDENLTWELPGYIPFEATKHFILRHVCQWTDPMVSCFNEVTHNMTNLITQLLDEPEHFGRFAELKALIASLVKLEEKECIKDTSTMLNKLFMRENSVPLLTQNTAAYGAERLSWYSQHGMSNRIEEAEDEEHKVMADVHAYFQIAAKRFIDQIPLSIEGELHQALSSRLEGRLFHAVVSMEREDLARMLREDPEIVARREHLKQRITRLTAIQRRVFEYEHGATGTLLPHLEPEATD